MSSLTWLPIGLRVHAPSGNWFTYKLGLARPAWVPPTQALGPLTRRNAGLFDMYLDTLGISLAVDRLVTPSWDELLIGPRLYAAAKDFLCIQTGRIPRVNFVLALLAATVHLRGTK